MLRIFTVMVLSSLSSVKNEPLLNLRQFPSPGSMIRRLHYIIMRTGGGYDLHHSTTQTAQFFAS